MAIMFHVKHFRRAFAGKSFTLDMRAVRRPRIIVVALLIATTGCGSKPLPEADSNAERLYATRCGGCHRPFQPSTMTAAMWSEQVEAMRLKMAQAGVAPLSAAEQRQILDYLERNAGRQ
jgi:hypothetical protein